MAPFGGVDATPGEDGLESNVVSPDYIDKMMVEQMNDLSIKERSDIYEEIHGVSNMSIEENEDMIKRALDCFEVEIQSMNKETRFPYDAIVNQPGNTVSKQIVQGRRFRLRFLRFVLFDVKKATVNLMGFLDFIQMVYGLDALKKFDGSMHFFINDRETQVAFRQGCFQLLPYRDRSGRRILTFFVADAFQIPTSIRIKLLAYNIFVAGEDEDTQKNGLVVLFLPGAKAPVSKREFPSARHRALVGKTLSSLPTRFASFHFCFPDTYLFNIMRAIVTLAISIKNSKYIPRVKFHNGDPMEMQYNLMGYGIPVSLIPCTYTGKVKVKGFHQWVKTRQLLDEIRIKGDDSNIVECPSHKDVIFRSTGTSCMLNPGNVVLRGLFETYHDRHVNAGQTEKRNLVQEIVEKVEATGGVFLVWDSRGWWVPIQNDKEKRSKVAKALRDFNRTVVAKGNRQSFSSSTNAFERQDGKRRKRNEGGDSSSDCGDCSPNWKDTENCTFNGCLM